MSSRKNMPAKTTKINILLFWFHNDWGVYGRAYERVAEHLAILPDVGKVVVIFPPTLVNDFRIKEPLHIRCISKKLTLISEIETNKTGLRGLFARIRDRVSQCCRERALNAYLRELGFQVDNTILWLFPPHPYIHHLMETVPNRGVVTHLIDNFTKFDPNHELYSYAHEQYPKVGVWSDLIVTTSKANQEFFSNLGKPCCMFWPAVDESFIGTPDLLPHRRLSVAPRLGYVGFIMDRTDLELIQFAAMQRPEWQFVLVGPQYPEKYLDNSGLLDLPNVEYQEAIPQSEVPAFLKSLDVCLMPHRDNEYSQSMGPLKLYQYLASGKPIVSTNVSGLEKIQEHIFVADDYQEFVDHIEKALQEDTLEFSSERIEVAKENTWPLRVQEMFDTVRSVLDLN